MGTRLFLAGVVALLLGIQFRFVDTFVLNERVSKLLNQRSNIASEFIQVEGGYSAASDFSSLDDSWDSDTVPREVTPPRWLGWKLISVGVVLILICPRFN